MTVRHHGRSLPSARRSTLAICAALVLGGCGGAASGDAGAEPEGIDVTIEGIAFEPDELTIAPGDTVMWTNEDDVDHTVTSGEAGDQGVPGVDEGTPAKPDGTFDGELARVGSTFSFTFDEAGTYLYFCRVHASMEAVITVE